MSEINQTWSYKQPPAEIWKYLTEPERIARWLMQNNFKAEVGFEFEFRTSPIPSLQLAGIIYCKVLEIIPLQKLVYTWKGGPGNGEFTLDTRVEWTLKTLGTGSQLSLKHTGFNDENISILNVMTTGWDKNMQKAITLLNN